MLPVSYKRVEAWASGLMAVEKQKWQLPPPKFLAVEKLLEYFVGKISSKNAKFGGKPLI